MERDKQVIQATNDYYYFGVLEEGRELTGDKVFNYLAESVVYSDGTLIYVYDKNDNLIASTETFPTMTEEQQTDVREKVITSGNIASSVANAGKGFAIEQLNKYQIKPVKSTERNNIITSYEFRMI